MTSLPGRFFRRSTSGSQRPAAGWRIALPLLLLAGACGSGDDTQAASASESAEVAEAPSTTEAGTTTEVPTTTEGTTTEPPTTEAPTTTEAPAATEAASSGDPDVDAVMAAFALVFDSTAPFADKAPHLENAAALEASNAAYEQAGSAMGGISLAPTTAVIDGDTATVTYDVLFGENAAYNALQREVARVDGVWVVSEASYCEFLASARTPCPN